MGNATSKGKEEEYLKNILLNKGARAAEQDIRRIWTYFDCNKNTTLEVKEVKKMQRLRVSLFKDEAYKLCEMDDDFMEQIDKHATTLINHPEILWRKLDINKDGHVRWDEFKTLAADCILVSPFASIIESFKRKKGGYSEEEHRGGSLTDGNQSEAEEAHSPSLVIEDQGIIQNGVLGDEIDEIETVDDTVASLHPYGWEGVLFDVQDLKTKIVTIRFPFGLCYAHPKNVKIHLEKHHPDPPGMDAVEKLEPCSVEALQRPGLSGSLFYDKVAMDALGSNDISMLSEEEMELLLPWLLTLPGLKDIVRRRLKASRRLIRKGFWLRLADFQMLPHGPFFVTELNQTTGMTNSINFFCRRLVQECEENYVFQDEQLYCPIWPEWDVCTIKVKKKFSSGNAPSLLHCKLEGLTSFTHPLMFKPDDIRSDMCVMHSFGIFNQIWKQSKPLFKRFSARVFTFDCCPMAQSVGVMQFIQGAVTLDEWKASVIQDLPEEDQINFICSAAGSYVACYVLGCRDRHFDNFMVKDDSTFLQIDFKRCFDRKASGPVDAPHFSIKADVKMELCKLKFKVVKGVDQYGNPIIKYPNGWHIFKELCWHALKALRAKGVAVVKLVTGMFAGLRKRVRYFRNVEAMKRWVHFALNLGATDEEARLHLLGLIDSGVTSVAKKLKNILHGLNVYRNKQTGPKEERIFKSTPRNRRRISHAEGFSNATLDKGDNTEGKQFHHRGRTVSVYSDYHHHHHRRHSPSLGSRKLIQRPPIKEDANASNSSNGHHITSNGSSFKGTKGLRNRTPTIDLSHQGYDESRVLNVYQLIRQRHEDLGKLDLSFNAFGLSGTRLISTGLLSCLNLRELHLGGLFFGPEGLKCISAFVSGNGVLEVLDVHQSQICEGGNYSGLKALCVALESLGCGLRELDISDNKIKHKGLEMVRQAIEKNFVIQEIRYQDNQFMPTDIDNINIQKLLRRNQMEKVVILTIESVRRIKVGHREKLKAKIFFPGSPTVESPAIAVKKDEVIWNFTTSFSVHESTIRTSVRVEIWGSKKIGYFQIGPSDLQIKSKETEKLSTKAGSSSSLAQEQKSRSSSPAANDRRNALIQKTRKSSEIRTYTLRDGHLNKGTIVVHVHAGDFLGGGIIRAIGEYRNSTEPRSRQKPEENDVTEELRKVVKNGFVMFEEGSDPFADVLFADEEIGMMQAMIESARTYTALRIEYRVGCHVVEKKVEVPIPDFTKIFVGFGVPASTIDDEELDESSESLGVNPSLRNLAHAYSSPKVFVSAPSMSGYRRMDEEERKMKKRALVRTASSERESVVRHPRLTRQARTISLPTSKAPNEMLSTSLETSKKHFSSNETAASLLLITKAQIPSTDDLLEAMTKDSRRRSKQFDRKELQNLVQDAAQKLESKSRTEGKLQRRGPSSKSLPPTPPSMRKQYTLSRSDKMKQLIMMSEIFHVICGTASSELKGRQLIDLVDVAGNRLPKVVKEKIKSYASGKKTVGANQMCVWLRKEGIDVEAMKSLVSHVRNVGSPRDTKKTFVFNPLVDNKDGDRNNVDEGEKKKVSLKLGRPHSTPASIYRKEENPNPLEVESEETQLATSKVLDTSESRQSIEDSIPRLHFDAATLTNATNTAKTAAEASKKAAEYVALMTPTEKERETHNQIVKAIQDAAKKAEEALLAAEKMRNQAVEVLKASGTHLRPNELEL